MKILTTGKDPRAPEEKPWWIGATVLCEKCGTRFQLEATDHVTRYIGAEGGAMCMDWGFDPVTGRVGRIGITCPTCRETVIILRSTILPEP